MDLPPDTSLIITVFNRHRCLEALLNSIEQFYDVDKGRLIVVDCSTFIEHKSVVKRVERDYIYAYLSPDAGVSACRNLGFEACRTKKAVLLEEDFVFTKKTDLSVLSDTIDVTGVDILGGSVTKQGSLRSVAYEGDFTKQEVNAGTTVLSCIPCPKFEDKIIQCDAVSNFFMALVDPILRSKWDARFKVWEHIDFFLSAMDKGVTSAWHSGVSVTHRQSRPLRYKQFRYHRVNQFRELTMTKHEISEIITGRQPTKEEWLSSHKSWDMEYVC